MAWEVIETLELYDIPVVSVTSDGAKPNRKFYKMCHSTQEESNVVSYKTMNPFREGEELFFFCDPPPPIS